VLLSLFSFVVKFGLMVQITDLWQFLLFLFPLLTTMQLLKLQMPKLAGLWGQLIVFMGSFISVTNPPVYDYAAFFNDNLSKIIGVGFAWLAFAVLSPGSDARKGRRHIRALRRHFVDQLSRRPSTASTNLNRWSITMSASSVRARMRWRAAGCCAGAWCC
jgi:uncharacterized membrane protein YccC